MVNYHSYCNTDTCENIMARRTARKRDHATYDPKRGGVAAKKCIYDNIEMESLTERFWASVYDTLRWAWAYEPAKLQYWKPDFRLPRWNGGNVWVEIKPNVGEWDAVSNKEVVWKKMEEAQKVNREKDVLLFSYAKPTITDNYYYMGWLGAWTRLGEDEPLQWVWDDAVAWYSAAHDNFGLSWVNEQREWLRDPATHTPPMLSLEDLR